MQKQQPYQQSGTNRPGSRASLPRLLFLAISLPFWGAAGAPAAVRLVKDINPQTPDYSAVTFGANPVPSPPHVGLYAGLNPLPLFHINGVTYNSGSFGAEIGFELLRSDGTNEGSYLLKDINVGSGSSDPGNFTRVGDTVFFTADDGCHGFELWKTDGTEAGTVLVSDLLPGEITSQVSQLTAAGNLLYFTYTIAGTNSTYLGRSDGTAAGTIVLASFNLNFVQGPKYLTAVGITLFFNAGAQSKGRELWKSDGTPGGTVLLKDIRTGVNESSPFGLTAFRGALYFFCDDGVKGVALYRSDGTDAGTVMVKDPNPGLGNGFSLSETSYQIAAANDFFCFETNDGVNGTEIWRSDGTTAGTGLLKDIKPGNTGYGTRNYLGAGSSLYFVVLGPAGREIWKTDGTEAGTVVVSPEKPFQPANMFWSGSRVFYTDSLPGLGREIWTTDGTDAGTQLLADLTPGVGNSFGSEEVPRFISIGGGRTAFFVSGSLLTTDGSLSGTRVQGSIQQGAKAPDSSPYGLTSTPLGLFLSAATKEEGYELWGSDGSAAGTVQLKDILPGAGGAAPRFLTPAGSRLYFWANAGTGYDLWKSDGTPAGTTLIRTSTITTSPDAAAAFGSNIIFKQGGSIWWSDGTAAGTVSLDLTGQASLENAPYFAQLGPDHIFVARRGTGALGLWKTNGTAAGTVSFAPGITGSTFITLGSSVLFWRQGNLWRTDGTLAGTVLVSSGFQEPLAPARLAPSTSHPMWLVVGNKLYTGGVEPLVTDGTPSGSILLKDIRPGTDANSTPSDFTELNGTVYFTASSLTEGKELWKTNGTPAGTVLVKDINPGICPSDVGYLAAMGGKLYFTANDGIHGAELWQSDGTAPGTQMVTDLYAGTPSAYPVDLTPLNGKLYFIASGYTAGRELWSFDPNLPEENTPTLTITKAGALVNVSWPAAYQNWNPEVSATLRPGSWVQSFQPVTPAGAMQTFSAPASGARFYRLRKN